jgi:hypothetical protein
MGKIETQTPTPAEQAYDSAVAAYEERIQEMAARILLLRHNYLPYRDSIRSYPSFSAIMESVISRKIGELHTRVVGYQKQLAEGAGISDALYTGGIAELRLWLDDKYAPILATPEAMAEYEERKAFIENCTSAIAEYDALVLRLAEPEVSIAFSRAGAVDFSTLSA